MSLPVTAAVKHSERAASGLASPGPGAGSALCLPTYSSLPDSSASFFRPFLPPELPCFGFLDKIRTLGEVVSL